MKFLNDIISTIPEFKTLLHSIKAGNLPVACSGLSSVHKAIVSSALFENGAGRLALITHDEATANTIYDDLCANGVNAGILCGRDYNLAHLTGYSKEYEHKRVDTLSKIIDGAFDVLVFSVDSALLFTLPPEKLKDLRLQIDVGGSLNVGELSKKLIEMGYQRSEMIEGIGQFSLRGDIIDIYSPTMNSPVRIELWGDEVDTVSYFDIDSQRRGDTTESITVCPAAELPYNPQELAEKLEKYLNGKTKFTKEQEETLSKDIEMLKSGFTVSPDLYIPFLYEKTATVFDYLSGFKFVFCETGNIKERIKSIAEMEAEDVKNLLSSGELSSKTANLRMKKSDFYEYFNSAVFFENFPRSSYEIALKELINFSLKRSSAWSGNIQVLCDDIEFVRSTKGTVIILAGESKAAGVMCRELEEKEIAASIITPADSLPKKGGVFVCTGGLSSGIEIPEQNFMLITHRYIRGEAKQTKRKIKNAKDIGSLDELKRGDFVVHSSHGIGVFDGINRITNDRVTKDYIKIRYAGTDILYVPVTQLDLVSKYIGSDEGIKLNKLGTDTWTKTRRRVRAAVKNMAKQLTALYAKRMQTKGYAFSPDTDLQSDFERRFEYDETDDQLRSINEIKGDMERNIPMDRLLCGDVGFGKTEVALRAAFKCVSEGKQCAILVPTTILANQHFATAKRRIGDLPVETRLLSRFVSKKEQTNTIKGLKDGRVDMVIGTHRLISKDIEFKNLGLVIIDEEQRFGVAQKERLKELYPYVDILTLSATPIPRTLNMAMSGLRDMSSIDEAPGDRHPVQTYVLEQNNGVLTDAINKELRRGGQVYYLHNRVEGIERTALRIKERIPEARIGIAHGKMSEDELNSVWEKLLEHEIDVLVCTTIIETGVDVPNVNTLIIEDADRMGLSQLHQLRGRVGRSPRRAYAYFCFRQGRELSEISTKRLEAIRQFTEFGSGFKIAMRDLEIRGAGSILGGEQHGNMEAVGYDMYLKLLADAVAEESGTERPPEIECTVDLNISAHIPERYIESLPARLGIYKRIADIKSDSDVSDVLDELCDRFGEPPKSVTGLIDIALLRNRAAQSGINEITGTPNSVILHTSALREETTQKLTEHFKDRFSISATGEHPLYIIKLKAGEGHRDLVGSLSKIL